MRATRYAKMMLLSVAALGSAVPAHAAEELGEIVVTVNSEETHRLVPNVAVVIESRSGETHSVLTDDSGSARFEGLDPGLYRLTATRAGFVQVEEPSVRVVARKTTPVKL